MGVQLQGRFKGRVIRYNVERGHGHVTVLDKLIREDAFIHWSEIDTKVDAFKKLVPGQIVEFSSKRSEKGLAAFNLVRLDGTDKESFGNR